MASNLTSEKTVMDLDPLLISVDSETELECIYDLQISTKCEVLRIVLLPPKTNVRKLYHSDCHP